MTDMPKAIHFDAFRNGVLMPHDSAVGMHVRWSVALGCRDAGIDMTQPDHSIIERVCRFFNEINAVTGIEVRLKVTGTQHAD